MKNLFKKFSLLVLVALILASMTMINATATENDMPVAKIGDTGYSSVAAALDAAYNAGMRDVVITLCGTTNASTTDSVDLYSKYGNGTAFNTITFKQSDPSTAYYLSYLYTGWTTGKVVFDGVNIVVTSSMYAIGNVELINNSTITRNSDVTNYIFYGNMTIEPGSKFVSQVDRIGSGSSLTVDGGKTDGTINNTADYKTVWLYVEAGNTMTIKNGAYVIVSNYEYAELEVSGTLNLENSRLDVFTAIKIGVNGVLKIDGNSVIKTPKITGSGKLVVDATGLEAGDVEALKNVNLSGFTGEVEIANLGNQLKAEIVNGKLTIKEPSYTSGTWGGIDWKLYADGTLVIAPTKGAPVADPNCGRTYEVGEMPEGVVYHSSGEYATAYYTPYDKNAVTSVVIENGVTTIGSFALKCPNLTGEVVIPASVVYVGQSAFQNAPITKLTFAEGDTEELCIAVGAFEGLKITELVLKREAHLHAWAFQKCTEMETAILADVTFEHGSKHVKYWYYGEEHASGNSGTWDSNTFAHNSKLETITFGTDETGINQFVAAPNSLTYYVASNGRVVYFDLQDAINAGGEVKLLRDVTIENTLKVLSDKTVTLDLNGKTINGVEKVRIAIMSYGNLTIKDSSADKNGIINAGIGTAGNAINICGGTFILESGNIYSKNNAILIDEQAATVTINGGKITAEPTTRNSAVMYVSSTSDTVINITDGELVGYNGILLWNNTTVNITGGTITAKGSTGIQGNGSQDNTKIDISGGTISGYYAAIYHPQGGELTISGGNLTGWTGVVVKGGTINISGGTITGTGAADTYRPVSSGYVDTGDALYVEHYDNSTNSENYGTPVVTVTGGTFTSANGKAVASYANSNVEALVGFISGGTFKTAVPENYCAKGYIPEKEGASWVVKPNMIFEVYLTDANGNVHWLSPMSSNSPSVLETAKIWYESLQGTYNFTLKLLEDYELDEKLIIDFPLTIDLNGKTLSMSKACTESYEMILNKSTLTITGNGKISFTDTSTGDPNFGWGSYTIRNEGILVVENGTIEHKGAQAFATHMICAIFQYSGSTTINGGTISTPNYRSIRLWKGDMTINGGMFDGQVWVQAVDNSSKLTINGGTFEPNGQDASSVFVDNSTYDVEFAVEGGTFNGKIGCSDATKLAGAISGGKFTETAKNNTNAELLNKECIFGTIDAEGYYGIQAAVAQIGTKGYATLAEAFAAAQDGDTIKLLGDIALDAGITNTKKVTLDLNGKTITGTDKGTASFGLITNKGELTITGNGTITLEATTNRGWNAYSSVISNTVGGKLVVENGTIEHLGGTDMAYAIDNLTNGKRTYAETVINGGTIKSTYRAIRQFLNGTEAQNILTVNGGKIEGANKSIWMQDPSASANTGKLTVGENAVLNGDVYLFVTAGSTEWPVEVSIANSALNGEVVTGNVPAQYAVKNVNGTWGVVNAVASVNGVGYATIEEAFAAAQDGDTLKIFAGDYTVDLNVDDKDITVIGETDANDGTNLVNINGTLNIIADGATVKNINVTNTTADGTAGYIKAKNVLIEGCTIVGDSAFAKCYTDGEVTFKNSKILGKMTNGIQFVGSQGGTILIDNCEISGYTTFSSAINNVTIKNSEFVAARNNTIRLYQDVVFDNTVFSPSTTIDFGAEYKTANFIKDCSVSDGSKLIDRFTLLDIYNKKDQYIINGEKTIVVAKIGKTKVYLSLAEAIAAANEGDIIDLLVDLTIKENIVKNVTILKGNYNVNVTGQFSAGTYDWNVNSNCATGYCAKDNGNNTWTVSVHVYSTEPTITAPTADKAGKIAYKCVCGAEDADRITPIYIKLNAISVSVDSLSVLKVKFIVYNDIRDTVTATVNNNIPVNLTTDENGRYVVSYSVTATNLRNTFEIKFALNGETLYIYENEKAETSVKRSVEDWCKLAAEKGTSTQKDLANALLNYGDCAIKYAEIPGEQKVVAAAGNSSNDIITVTQYELLLHSYYEYKPQGLTLRVYFQLAEGKSIGNYNFAFRRKIGTYRDTGKDVCVDIGVPHALDSKTGYYYIDIYGIPAAYIDYDYAIFVKENVTTVATISTSVLEWAVSVLADQNATADLTNFANAIIEYNVAANAHFGK